MVAWWLDGEKVCFYVLSAKAMDARVARPMKNLTMMGLGGCGERGCGDENEEIK